MSDKTATAIRLRDVSVTTAGMRRLRLGAAPGAADGPVLVDVNLEVASGEVVSILGESGGGKSTLLRLVNRMVDADAGTIAVAGRAVRSWPVAQLRRTAIYVPQRAFLFGGTVADEMYRPLAWRRRARNPRPTADDITAAEAALAIMELADVDRALPADELSEGQRARLCLARALLLEPSILLLDEPTGSLDLRTARALLGKLRAWAAQRNVALVCVTHRPEDVGSLGGRAVILLGGRIAGTYPAAAIAAADHGALSDEVRRFLEGITQEQQ